MEPSDGELVQRIARGARDAEAELCRRFAPRVRLYGLRHLGDEDRARELVQAVLLAMIEAARTRRIEELDKVDRFVLGISRNTALAMRRTEARVEQRDHDVLALLPADEVARPELSALLRCMQGLEERARKVVFMSFNEERSADEIGGLLSMTPGNVRVVRHRAITALRTCIEAGP